MLLIRGGCRSGAKYAFVKVNVICTKTQGLRITYTPNSRYKIVMVFLILPVMLGT